MIEHIDKSLRDLDERNNEPVEGNEKLEERNEQEEDQVEAPEMKLGLPLKMEHNEKQAEIVNAFKHAWKEYKASAWGMDEVKPISHSSSTWFNLGLTIIDSLDTIWLMGLEEEFNEARRWVEHGLNIAQRKDINLFEVTIRVLGGLLSAYHLTKDTLFLEKAVRKELDYKGTMLTSPPCSQTDLGDRLLGSFSSASHVPYSDINLYTMKGHPPGWGPDSSVSEVTSIQLEFRDLSQLTGFMKYQEAVDKVMEIVQVGK